MTCAVSRQHQAHGRLRRLKRETDPKQGDDGDQRPAGPHHAKVEGERDGTHQPPSLSASPVPSTGDRHPDDRSRSYACGEERFGCQQPWRQADELGGPHTMLRRCATECGSCVGRG
ncbi:hypothetical protein GCM10023080_026580 [Streptomyces pseudoechinosporeus]